MQIGNGILSGSWVFPDPSTGSPSTYLELSEPTSPRQDVRLLNAFFPLGVRADSHAEPGTGMVTYSADMLFASYSFLQVTNPDLPFHDSDRLGPLALGADWLLAALAIDNDATVNTTRPFARILAESVRQTFTALLARPARPDLETNVIGAAQVAVFAAMQAGSLVGYD